jgi:hypothetical protein
MGDLLFSPQGIIGKQAFHKGAVILLAVNFFMWPAWYAGLGIGFLATFLSFILIYNWACLYTKRLRGAGKSPTQFIWIFIGFVFASYIVGNAFMAWLAPEILEEAIVFQETMDPKKPDLDLVLPFYEKFFKAMAIPHAAAYFIIGSIFAFRFNASLPDINPKT